MMAQMAVAMPLMLAGEQGVIVTTDRMQLTLGNMANRALFRDSADVEERPRLVAPFVTMGQKLCDQPPGARVGHGEL